ncbi:MAG: ABC transporter permease [Cellvibrionaceae bacterium]
MLALRLLWRNWRSGEVKILASALILAVAVVSCISIFTDRLEQALVAQSHTFLGADRVVRSSKPIDSAWRELVESHPIETANTVQFASMVFSGERMHLASVKAVSEGYPLLGKLTISQQAFATDPQSIRDAQGVPAVGEVWADSRLLPLLNIELGDNLSVGEKTLKLTHVIIDEPDRGSNFSAYGARVMMNELDLAATQVVQPGSRIRYQWLLAGDESALLGLLAELEPLLTPHDTVVDVESAQQGLAKTLSTARKFLLLSAMIGVLLAGVAIAIAARRFAQRHVDQVALLKSLGASSTRVRQLYALQLLVLGSAAAVVGLLIGQGLQWIIASAIASVFPVALEPASWSAYLPGLTTGVVCLICFVAPPLWHLPLIPPIKILRRELQVGSVAFYWQASLGLLAMIVLVAIFSNDVWLSVSIISAMLVLMVMTALFAVLLLRLGSRVGRRVGSVWRLALASLNRNAQQSVIQMMVFGLAIMLLLTLTSLRTTLIEDWQLQLPPETPNHFLLNISPAEKDTVLELMEDQGLEPQFLFPMVRARLTHINGLEPSEEVKQRAEMLRREANLSWTETLNNDNQIVDGQWWDEWSEPGVYGISVEAEAAEELGVSLGDDIRFSVGGLNLEARVASIRTLKWDSMNPNFYFLMSPGALENFSPMYLTSVYLNPENKLFINQLLERFPTIVVIEMDRVIAQIQSIVAQVSVGIELMLWLVLLGGFMVMWAAVSATMDERKQETALLRALGSSRKRLLGSLWIEFSLLGGLAGVMAVFGAEVLLLSIQHWVLDMPLQAHFGLWVLGTLGAMLMIGTLGVFACRRVITTPPGLILREIG